MYQIVAKHRDGRVNDKLKYKAELHCSRLSDWDEPKLLKIETDTPF